MSGTVAFGAQLLRSALWGPWPVSDCKGQSLSIACLLLGPPPCPLLPLSVQVATLVQELRVFLVDHPSSLQRCENSVKCGPLV